jgi:hypothetical protein
VRPMQMNTSDLEESTDGSDNEGDAEARRRAKQKKRRVRAQSQREYSWIWLVPRDTAEKGGRLGQSATEEDISEGESFRPAYGTYLLIDTLAMRVEYGKAHARARRYVEEEELILEEMGRTLRFLKWKSDWWLSLDVDSNRHSSRVREGRKAYSAKQAFLLKALSSKFNSSWRNVLNELNLVVDW